MLSRKQDTLTFDTTPTEGSSNPVTSDGIDNALGRGSEVKFENAYTAYDELTHTIPIALMNVVSNLAGASVGDYALFGGGATSNNA